MTDPDRAAGPTFAIDDIGWIDFETRSDTDLKVAGATRYATEADAIVLAYAIGNGPVNTVKVTAFDGPLRWDDVPSAIKLHFDRVARGEAIWAAWNAGFDRAIWNFATEGFPEMPPEHIIDVMAQATASGLPPDLAKASEAIGKAVKEGSGKDLIKLFCTPAGLKGVRGTPQTHPEEWRAFDAYASGDIEAMRSVFRSTRQLPLAEWREYWAMEAINDRGVCIDVRMVREAADLAEEDRLRSRHALKRLTGGIVETVDQVAKMTAWLMARLPAEGRDILTKTVEEVDEETGEVIKPAKLQLTRKRIERLIAFCETRRGYPQADPILQVLQIRRYGGSKTPAKFAKMLAQQVDGRLYGQYVFNGAPQTGRASSRGVQIHNLARDVLGQHLGKLGGGLGAAIEPDLQHLQDWLGLRVTPPRLTVRDQALDPLPRQGVLGGGSDQASLLVDLLLDLGQDLDPLFRQPLAQPFGDPRHLVDRVHIAVGQHGEVGLRSNLVLGR